MPELTRRRYPERPDCWHVYYGDVRVGTIAMRVGNPHDTDPWEWICGFYPGCEPGEHQNATAATFDRARGFRGRLAVPSAETNRGRLSGVARSARLDVMEICDA